MNYKIVADSSCDLTEQMKENMNIELIPFKISVEDREFVDNDNIDLDDLIKSMKKSQNPVKTACPSPGDYLNAFKDSDVIFVVTISSKLSGSYNSAVLARQMALDENDEKFIHVFDSKSASTGEVLVALKIKELIDENASKETIVEEVEQYIEEMNTMFILTKLDNLIKNGRISKTKGLIATALKFTPIMKSNDGEIELLENIRGNKKAFNRLVEAIGELTNTVKGKTLAISHVNALDKAELIKEMAEQLYDFKDIILLETKGLSSSYADDGGIILSY
ncbi:MAG TPA: DegV family protein [Tissierellaceae bacterium]